MLYITPQQKGMLYMLVAILIHTLNNAFIRFCLVNVQMPVTQAIFLRSVCRLSIIVCLLFATHTQPFKSKHIPFHMIRACFAIPVTFCFVEASSLIPMTNINIIGHLTPILTVILGVCFLSEKLSAPICISAIVSFTGAYIAYAHNTTILWKTGALLAFIGSFANAIDNIMRRYIALKDTPLNIMFYQNLFATLVSMVPLTKIQCITLNGTLLAYFICSGICITCAQYLVMKSFQLCNASTLAPLNFSDIVLVIFLDAYIWGNMLTIETAVAAVLIISSNIYYLTKKQ